MLRYRIYSYNYGFAATLLRMARRRLPSAWRGLVPGLVEIRLHPAPSAP